MRTKITLLTLVLGLSPAGAFADVADASSSGFTIKTALTIQAAPEVVYQRLIHNVGDWWSPSHTFSRDPHNLSIEEKPMGCFCEKLPNQGSVRHMEVVFLAPGKAIGMIGALGPLQSLAATGSMRIQLSPVEGGTKLEVVYAVSGYLAAGMNTWAAPVDSVLTEQFTRLKGYIERGDPAAKVDAAKQP
jgi:hypothetical protein